MTISRRDLGAWGERQALCWYQKNKYDLVETNWRVKQGEIDLIVQKSGLLVFAEVKTRSSDLYGSGFEAVDFRKQKQIRKLASIWLTTSDTFYSQIRFDVVAVDRAGNVETLEGCF